MNTGTPEQTSRPPVAIAVAFSILILFSALGFAIFLVWPDLKSFAGEVSYTVVVTNLMTLVLAPIVLTLACLLTRPEVRPATGIAENLLAVVLGTLAGWALAIFWVPYGNADTKIYGQIGGAVAVFVSGYAISKIDKVLDKKLFPTSEPDAHVLTKILLALASLTLAALTIVTNRVSWLERDMQKQPEVYAARAELEAALAQANARAAARVADRAAAKEGDPVTAATKAVESAERVKRVADEAAQAAQEVLTQRRRDLALAVQGGRARPESAATGLASDAKK